MATQESLSIKKNMSQCQKGESNLRFRPILDITQWPLWIILRYEQKKKHNTRQIYWSIMYVPELVKS